MRRGKRTLVFICTIAMLIASTGMVFAEETEVLPAGSMENFIRSLVYEDQFADVADTAWYSQHVKDAYEYGFVSGNTENTYSPDNEVTIAEALVIACRLHSIYYDAEIELSLEDGDPWYQPYVDYALENGILERELDEYDRPISRGGFLEIFYRALPESAYAEINQIPDGAIPDVEADSALGAKVYAFYRAGILTGYTAYSFGADSEITRAEMATIMNRMFDSSARQRFSIP